MKAESILAGCGAGILFTLPYIAPLLSPSHLMLYHSRLPVRSVAWGLLIDLAVVSLLAALLIAYLDRRRSGWLNPVWALIGAGLAVGLVRIFAELTSRPDRHRDLIRAAGLTLVLVLAFRWLRPPLYRMFARGLFAVLLLAGVSVAWIVPELLFLGLRQPTSFAAGSARVAPARKAAPEKNGRIVWLLFDELSYDQTFEHRAAGLSMPSFDNLKRSSVLFEDLRPVGYYTELAVPSLFLGETVARLKSDMEGEPKLKIVGQSGWRDFDERATIFEDAQRAGWTTGIVGWYNPYCRILAGMLDFCYTAIDDREPNGMMPSDTALENARAVVETGIRSLEHKPSPFKEEHKDDFQAIMGQAALLLRDEHIRFVFIHLPIPHPPGIYDRETGKLRDGGSYIDNLALSDRALGRLMAVLSATPSAARTTVVVCSDHSWRVAGWRSWPSWTKEEEAASQGKFDPRPMLMIHFPSQSAGILVTRPFEEIRLHQVLLRMLDGEMSSPAEFAGWLENARHPRMDVPAPSLSSANSPHR